MGVELELYLLLVLFTLGSSIFAVFEVETPWWRKALKLFTCHGGHAGGLSGGWTSRVVGADFGGWCGFDRPLRMVPEKRHPSALCDTPSQVL